MKVCWLSAGASSFVAGYLARETVDKYIYIDIADQHPDSMRFIRDCEKTAGQRMRNTSLDSIRHSWRCVQSFQICKLRTWSQVHGNPQKRVRKQWEYEHRDYDLTYVWGFDLNEKHRAERLFDSMAYAKHEFPLIEQSLTKANAHAICSRLGIRRPAMYDMGYSNNNCIGCVKGGKGYWNKIRVDFPDVFEDRAKMEREIGHSILHDKNGMIFLDELDPSAGKMSAEIMDDCSIFCQLAIQDDAALKGGQDDV